MTPSEGRRHTEKRTKFCRDNEGEETKALEQGLRAREGTRNVRSSRTDPIACARPTAGRTQRSMQVLWRMTGERERE